MKLLVANRGEIAVRIMATAAAMGVRTVAVYPDDDAGCAHVARADEAVELPGTGPTAYLDVEQVVAAARATGCDVLHPGYGFLSENPALSGACADAGIAFVGPGPGSLALFGDKTAARARAAELGIPVLDGTDAPTDLPAARAFLDGLGPGGAVMVKAVAGGGGRGMRAVTHAGDLDEALRRCSSEAQTAFGDGSVFVERLLPRARHIEVQILGDGTDTVVLGDRDCSAQRRRQKLVEIAPAPGLTSQTRTRLHEAARLLVSEYSGLATVEFLLAGDEIAFIEVNPRIQVEHTVTEEVTGLDPVELGLEVALGAKLGELGLSTPPPSRETALQVRVNAESIAEVIVTQHSGDLGHAAARARRALAEFDIAGVPTGLGLLRALLARPELAEGRVDTSYVDDHLADLLADPHISVLPATVAPQQQTPTGPGRETPPGTAAVRSTQQGLVVAVAATAGDVLPAGAELIVLEAMKMEHVVRTERAGVVHAVVVGVGDDVLAGDPLAFLDAVPDADVPTSTTTEDDPTRIRPDLAESIERHRTVLDDGRPAATELRHARGRRTARENLTHLLDPDSFVEYGALTIAAQRRRRTVEDLLARTPADGLITGTGTVGGLPVAVMSYDYTVLAGTQGVHNHRKTDRLLTIAAAQRLPVVIFAEGGGGRPGDTDTSAIAQLDVPTFRLLADLRSKVPTVAIVAGYCFAGNAALAGSCDTIIATEGSSLGMGGPATIEGGGLGVVDRLVADDDAAVTDVRRYLSYFGATTDPPEHTDQTVLRTALPENRLRAYPIRPVLDTLFDTGTVTELRGGFGVGILTALARLDGRTVGVLANNSHHLGGPSTVTPPTRPPPSSASARPTAYR